MAATNQALVRNIQEQLIRLMKQLEDLNEERAEMTEEDYEEAREDSVEQLKDLERTLSKMEHGDISTIDELTTTKMAIRAAIGEAFKTPEIVALFARKQPAALRQKLIMAETEHKLGSLSTEGFLSRKAEVLMALQKLREPLSDEEENFLKNLESKPTYNLTEASSKRTVDDNIIEKVI
ncbi:unnamed protein product [Auanema sp. JU1783]|nr:unnamed protein product [Auanema sp. JU1783]